MKKLTTLVLFGMVLILLSACSMTEKNELVIYTSVDQIYSEPIFNLFEKETGIKVKAVYDVESQKTTGMASRLEAEKSKPVADLFWNGEFTKTIALTEKGVLSDYIAFGGRARVLLVNTEKIKPDDYPTTLTDLLSEKYQPSMIAIARPMFGTTFSQACALYAQLGDEPGKIFFEQVKNRGIKIVEGNSVVRDMVVSGEVAMGLTDTDDAYDAINKEKPVAIIFLDQKSDEMGTLIIPNTIAFVSGRPESSSAKEFMDFITSDKAAVLLYESGWIDFVEKPELIKNQRFDFSKVKGMKISLEEICEQQDVVVEDLTKLFMD
ncbi:extracellular solute-binding protein [Alkalibaculum bacchi]|uniref:extracellular solute-binding protein n=1 Tax=Alkalibaculum bacchi TaxID=645887 RepID=UPI0026EBB9B0|nr:extracellular solute-binding protein [Alkalibaculum bacchi]